MAAAGIHSAIPPAREPLRDRDSSSNTSNEGKVDPEKGPPRRLRVLTKRLSFTRGKSPPPPLPSSENSASIRRIHLGPLKSASSGNSPQRHVPIVISQDLITSILNPSPRRVLDLPDSPNSGEFKSVRPSSGSSGDSPGTKVIRPRPRYTPIQIPSFAQPYGPFPLTPASSGLNTPRFSLLASGGAESPHLWVLHPGDDDDWFKVLDYPKTVFAGFGFLSPPKRDQHYLGSETDIMSTTQTGVVNGSFHDQSPQVDPRSATSNGAPRRFAGVPASTGVQSSQPAPGTTNIAGMVCNVHRCTGREPHALVGATTTILGDKLYVFGGRKFSRRRPQLTSDLYELDLIRRHWTKIEATGDVPPPRYFHSVCALGDNKLVCYGGMSPAHTPQTPAPSEPDAPDQQPEVVVMADIHIYDIQKRHWTYIQTSSRPQGRYAHCATIIPSLAIFASSNAPLSAIHHNPSSANPHQGTLGVALDGTGGAEMIVVGGQDSANHYIEQISVFNLRSLEWTSTQALGRSCGSYRSIVTPLTGLPASKIGMGPEASESEDGTPATETKASTLIYSNYNFLDVKLELQVRTPDGALTERTMHGQYSPPGLRFPTGGVLDNHFVVSGTYLTSSRHEYALWALDLKSLTWSRIDAGGSIFNSGSWNRGVLWPRRNTFVILGNRKRNLMDDYNHRRINFTNICLVELESFGLYDNPRTVSPTSSYTSCSAAVLPKAISSKSRQNLGGRPVFAAAQELGQMSMGLRELSDMDIVALQGERIPVNSRFLARRWGPYFIHLLRESASSTDVPSVNGDNGSAEVATLRPPTQGASRNSSITITPSINPSSSSSTTHAPSQSIFSASSTLNSHTFRPNNPSQPSHQPPTPSVLPPTKRSRTLYLPHAFLTIQALLYFFQTSSLPPQPHSFSTPQILCSLLQLARPYRIDGLLEAVVQLLHQSMSDRNAAAVFNASAMAAGGGRATGSDIFGDCHGDLLEEEEEEEEEEEANGIGETNGRMGNRDMEERRHTQLAARPDAQSASNDLSRANLGRMALRIDTSVGARPLNSSSNPNHRHLANGNNHVRRRPSRDTADSEDDRSSVTSSSTSTHSRTDGSETYLEERAGVPGDGYVQEVWAGGVSCVVGLQKRGLRGLMEGRRLRERGRSLAEGGGAGGIGNGEGGGGG